MSVSFNSHTVSRIPEPPGSYPPNMRAGKSWNENWCFNHKREIWPNLHDWNIIYENNMPRVEVVVVVAVGDEWL